ncbi:hypothetical protein Golax_015212 [Gossypium laxum]|uniref:Uncharacterized protein n=1 Tax=Gossypium laxum TaxID=34288 RepID=A0A7J8ZX47_9ROSI|nr:hypothetical protein [Gossypium laxum]
MNSVGGLSCWRHCCLLVLQSWARFCFSFLRPQVDHLYTFSLLTR